ncbi:hypothetical protein G6011_01117 [Alternaria panax]|uniref:Uncharacterized protein n=1 Tax=Alternaria panax TaxID=48097 RepID=A0AAD4NU97_9PLEO|nr:hypothetical protein G6011_01117 [Alternaria panax]
MKGPRPSNSEYCHQVYVESLAGAPVEISDHRDGRINVGGYIGDAEIALQFVDFDDTEPEVLETGRCYRPILAGGGPIIAKITMHALIGKPYSVARETHARGGVFVNTGQGTSGIRMGPGSGLVMGEIIRGLQPSADISGSNVPT